MVELGQTSRHFIVRFEKIPTKKFPRYGRCAVLGSDLIPSRDVFLGIKLLGCFPRGYFVLLGIFVISSFSSRSYPPVRKRTDHCDMNMSTSIALKSRTRCYLFDQYIRKCNNSLVVNIMNDKKIIFFPMVSTVLLLLCETSCQPQQQEQGLPAAVPGLATTDAKLHCCCCWCCSPMLLLLSFGHTHAHKNCASDLWVEGIQTTSRDTPAGCAASRP